MANTMQCIIPTLNGQQLYYRAVLYINALAVALIIGAWDTKL